MVFALALTAVCLIGPVSGPVTAGYSPVGSYGGHWGVDYAVPVGTEVLAPASGQVTFAGSVAGMRSVTIEPIPGFKVSLSYLSEVLVKKGDRVTRGERVGLAGEPHGKPGVHLSTRIGGRYVDPATQMGCRKTDITRALRLVTPPLAYSRRREHRHSWRDLRPDPYSSPSRRRDSALDFRPRSSRLHAGRGPLAESRPGSLRS